MKQPPKPNETWMYRNLEEKIERLVKIVEVTDDFVYFSPGLRFGMNGAMSIDSFSGSLWTKGQVCALKELES